MERRTRGRWEELDALDAKVEEAVGVVTDAAPKRRCYQLVTKTESHEPERQEEASLRSERKIERKQALVIAAVTNPNPGPEKAAGGSAPSGRGRGREMEVLMPQHL